MDLFGILYVPNFILITLAIVISLYFYGRRTFGHFAGSGIKGPKPTAFLGNLVEMGQAGFAHAFSIWQKQYGDNYCIFFGAFPDIVVGDPEIIGEVLVKSFSNFTNRPLAFQPDEYGASMLSLAKDDHWKYLRTVLAPSYSSKRMREMVPLIEDVLKTFDKKLNDIVESKEARDVTDLFSGYTMDVIASTGFGIKVDSQENPDSPIVKNAKKVFAADFFKTLQVVAVVFPAFATIANWLKLNVLLGNMRYFINFCKELVEERRTHKDNSTRKDLLQLMLDAQLEGHEKLDKKTEQELKLENITDWRTKRGLTDVEVIAQCMIFFLAGFETTATTLSYFAHSIARNPDVQDKLCQEIEEKLGQESPNYDNVQKLTYLDMCLDETLRLYPIGLMLIREAKEDCIIKGLKIPKNTGILVSAMALHYDPRYWPEPEKFDPERFSEENKAKQIPFTYLPFGGGPRICAGMRLAQLEFKMAVVQMLRKFRLVACDKTEKKIEFAKAGLLKPKNGVWIKIEHR
ncbi:TBXAS1 [Acanthosepion pharaonis]|uniref:TBXAS1 n=1 Tax=Acanthosepion pharaonis TaxID=158019 RepID=A0A812C632_ACAPH|nr:TBXAS1 [Sepia pharaonis]